MNADEWAMRCARTMEMDLPEGWTVRHAATALRLARFYHAAMLLKESHEALGVAGVDLDEELLQKFRETFNGV